MQLMTRADAIARIRELAAWGDDEAALPRTIEKTAEVGDAAGTHTPLVNGEWLAALAQCALVLLDEEMTHV